MMIALEYLPELLLPPSGQRFGYSTGQTNILESVSKITLPSTVVANNRRPPCTLLLQLAAVTGLQTTTSQHSRTYEPMVIAFLIIGNRTGKYLNDVVLHFDRKLFLQKLVSNKLPKTCLLNVELLMHTCCLVYHLTNL
jgi:hypothetical protein